MQVSTGSELVLMKKHRRSIKYTILYSGLPEGRGLACTADPAS
jgi:hypothetical protein